MSVQPIIVRILVLMWSFMMVGQQVRLCWGDFARGRLGMRLSCRVETKCLWCSILEKQLLVDLKRNMNPQRPVVSTLSSLFLISSFIIFKFSSYTSLVLISGEALPIKTMWHTKVYSCKILFTTWKLEGTVCVRWCKHGLWQIWGNLQAVEPQSSK